jgi:hypothetical protein
MAGLLMYVMSFGDALQVLLSPTLPLPPPRWA